MDDISLQPIRHLGKTRIGGPLTGNWRPLTEPELSTLKVNHNYSDNWSNLEVAEGFNPSLVSNCKFYGRVRIGKLTDEVIAYHSLILPVGLYSSTIVSCIIGDNVALHNLDYISNFIVEDCCIIFNVNEMITTENAKFGNGIVMEGECEDHRIWLEVANENGGRKILPFVGLVPADAWLWSKYRSDSKLMERMIEMTAKVYKPQPGNYGRIGRKSVIKNSRTLKDVMIGSHAYIKGANKLKNLTINSNAAWPSQIGEGCELLNGIIGYNCRIFYGVKALRFVLCNNSELKYGTRLINTVLGPNSTISCCEVLNSLIFGSHEQHHNSSFLCASLLKGQTNIASAATVGSNHNSRAPDGEIVADRGFWPGLAVSLKHNSRFAAFILIAKGSYPAELDIPLPFTLVSNSHDSKTLLLSPGYWFHHNLYALARNSAKAKAREKCGEELLEYDWLAPDTVDQMRSGLKIMEAWAEETPEVKNGTYTSGAAFLASNPSPTLFATDSYRIEASRRPVRILHAGRAWNDFHRMIRFYVIRTLLGSTLQHVPTASTASPDSWVNLGGQLITRPKLSKMISLIKNGELSDWPSLHQHYHSLGQNYDADKQSHALALLQEIFGSPETPKLSAITPALITEALQTAAFILEGIKKSRLKDYQKHFRNINFDSPDERDAVLGLYHKDAFIQQATHTLDALRQTLKFHLQ